MSRRALAFVAAAIVGLIAIGIGAVLLGAGGTAETRQTPPPTGLILYTIGASTDPYGSSSPAGFGIARLRGRRFAGVAEVRSPELGWFNGAEWLGDSRILVPQSATPFRPRLIFRLDGSTLVREGPLPLPPADVTAAVSPDGRLVASEPSERCTPRQSLWECNRQTGEIYVQRLDGSGRRLLSTGHFDTWTPDGRLLVTSLDYDEPYEAVDVETGKRSRPLDPARVARFAGTRGLAHLGPPRWSADGRYLAARFSARWPGGKTRGAVVIADRSGKPLRLLRSRYVISMFVWSPNGHRLAYTTSGFPDPHELFVVDSPQAPARPVLTTERHFDWVTWAPDSRRLLLDDAVEGLWLLVPAQPPYEFVASPRLGGRPLWCCPVNAYATQ